MKNVFITGVNGFVGTALAERFLEDASCRVVGLVRDRNYKTMSSVQDRCSIVYGDIRDYSTVRYAMSHYEIDTVFHLGAVAVLRMGNQDPITCYETNVMGTVNVLEAARSVGVKKVVAASSDKSYGTYKELPYKETMHVQSSADSYSTSKACMDLICESYATTYGLDVSVVRSGNIYGPGDLNMSRLIPKSILKCLDGRRPVIYKGVGQYKREFMFVEDVVNAYLAVAEFGLPGNAYNIGGSGFQTIIDTCAMIMEITGMGGSPELMESDFIEIKEQYLDASKIMNLGWECKYKIYEGLEKTIEWYKQMKEEFPHKFIY